MYFSIIINWVNPFPILGLLGGIFHFDSICKRNFSLQTVDTLVRRHVMWRLIYVSAVCLCPTKKTVGLNTLTCLVRKLNIDEQVGILLSRKPLRQGFRDEAHIAPRWQYNGIIISQLCLISILTVDKYVVSFRDY